MDTKIQELTDKIYKEGVEKGNEEAGRIIAEANAQKDTILKDAEAEAKRIVAAAEKQAAELKKNTEAELKLFATQSVEALKSEVTNLITGDIASSNVKAALMDPAYMQKVILELVKSWPANEFLTIQASDSDGLKAYFEANAKGLLEKGYKIEKVSGKKASFSIIPADGSYKVTFGEDEFIEFFKEFLEAGALSIRRFPNGMQQMIHIPAYTQLIEWVVHLTEDFRKVFASLRAIFKAPSGIFQLYHRGPGRKQAFARKAQQKFLHHAHHGVQHLLAGYREFPCAINCRIVDHMEHVCLCTQRAGKFIFLRPARKHVISRQVTIIAANTFFPVLPLYKLTVMQLVQKTCGV